MALPLDGSLSALSPWSCTHADVGAGACAGPAQRTSDASHRTSMQATLQTPLVSFTSPRALDIDSGMLTAIAQIPSTAVTAAPPSGSSGGGRVSAAGLQPTPSTRMDGYSVPQARRGPLEQVTVDYLLASSTAQGDDGADDAADVGADGAGEGTDDGALATCTCGVAPGDEEAPTGGATSTGGGGGTVRAGTHGSLGGEGGAEDNELVVRPHDLQTLRAMSAAEISAIEDFEVSRPGCGSLRWSGRTDLRAVLPRLAEIVRFKPHQVLVYDSVDGLPKPPPGEGLNKKCTYIMEGVWARDRVSGDFLSDAKSIAAFRAQLLRKADRMQARMVGYDHQRGEWAIEVAHF